MQGLIWPQVVPEASACVQDGSGHDVHSPMNDIAILGDCTT